MRGRRPIPPAHVDDGRMRLRRSRPVWQSGRQRTDGRPAIARRRHLSFQSRVDLCRVQRRQIMHARLLLWWQRNGLHADVHHRSCPRPSSRRVAPCAELDAPSTVQTTIVGAYCCTRQSPAARSVRAVSCEPGPANAAERSQPSRTRRPPPPQRPDRIHLNCASGRLHQLQTRSHREMTGAAAPSPGANSAATTCLAGTDRWSAHTPRGSAPSTVDAAERDRVGSRDDPTRAHSHREHQARMQTR